MGNIEKLEKAKVNMDYKEKLEKAKELYPTANADQRYVLECLFPELKETEDEKIRKAIVEFFVLQDDNTTYSLVPKKDILAWLEKQGEQKLPIEKPAEWSEEDEKYIAAAIELVKHCSWGSFGGIFREDVADWLRSLNPQPKWSEKDEMFFKTVLWHVSYSISNGESTDIHCDTTEWLKSVKQRLIRR